MAPGKLAKVPTSMAKLHEVIRENNDGFPTTPPQSDMLVHNISGGDVSPKNNEPQIHVTRGKTKGKGLNRYMRAYGKIPVHFPESKGRPINRITSAKFSNELGIIARNNIPAGTMSYKKLGKDEKALLYERIKDKFNLLDDGPHVKRCIDTILGGRFRDHICKLHKKWKEMIKDGKSYAEARQNPPEGVVEDDWTTRCGRWENKEYQIKCAKNEENRAKNELKHVMGSMSYVVARNEMGNPDRVEFYEKCYGGPEKKDFKSKLAEENYKNMENVKESYPEMTPDNVADVVLGKKSGRIPGLGFGPKLVKSSIVGDSSLESIVLSQQEQLKSQGDQIKLLQELVAKLVNASPTNG